MVLEDVRTEEWNMALAYMKRIDELLTICSKAQMGDNGILWCKALQALHKEVWPKLKPKERERANELKNAMLIEINANRPKKTVDTKFLLDYELFLRDMLEQRNMLTPKPSDPRWAAANR